MPADSTSVVLAHHWLVTMRGGEKVLEQLAQLFPRAPIYTLVAKRESYQTMFPAAQVVTSPLQWIPGATRYYRQMMPLFPWALRNLCVPPQTKLVISSDASVIKGLSVPEGVPHVCYCHSPPRYLWDLMETYAQGTAGLGGLGQRIFRAVVPRVRQFDVAAAKRVDHFIANSRFVQERIQKCYQREATVIYPPVDVDAFNPQQPSEDFYLLISALTPYKRVDIAVEAFNRMGKTLIVIGDGPELDQLRAQAKPHVRFLGTQPFAVLKAHYERCRAFIFPQLEDFGITAVEAQAAGKPVLAYRAGGVLDSVVEGETGLFFDEQTPESLIAGVEQLERTSFSPECCRRQAEKFRAKVFREQLRAQLRIWYPTMF